MTIKERLEYLRGEITAERISYGGIAELAGLADYIEPHDTDLLEWAGVPEFHEDGETVKCYECRLAESNPYYDQPSDPA